MSESTVSSHRFAICICNDDYAASLELRKIYEVLPDSDASKHHQIRVIDESGEDYLYPEHYFIPIDLPKDTEAAVIEAA